MAANCLTAQTISVSGIANHYLEVDSVEPDRVRVVVTAELAHFQPGDKIMIVQMTGSTLHDASTVANFKTNPGKFHKAWNQVGSFEILQLDEVYDDNGKWIAFTDAFHYAYDPGEKIQLVKLVEADVIRVTAPLGAKPWDGKTGGIVGLLGMDSVLLNSSIDVSNQGYRGAAVPDENYTGIGGVCRADISALVLDTLHFLPSEINRSGLKGEGVISVAWPYNRGLGFALNGGGAGNGLFSGGGGGSNFRLGGTGGKQSSACGSILSGAWGGYGCQSLYLQYELFGNTNPRVIMGGGGGTGVKTATKNASAGGNGGGMVFILTGVLAGNGNSILANGENIASTVTGSGGGGGGGGTVVLDATSYFSNVNVVVKGGNGGNTNDGTVNCIGSGGGGSGGVIWFSGNNYPPQVAMDTARGEAGTIVFPNCAANIGTPGGYGTRLKGLITPLTGFLFNTIRGVDTICAGQVPNQLVGSLPKGGNGIYTYIWEQSADKIAWNPASGSSTGRHYNPPALSQTTYYRRIVSSEAVFDTARTLEVFVYPAISNNIISGRDTICYNSEAKPLPGTQPAGGNNSYTYQWQLSTNQLDWSSAGSPLPDNDPYSPGPLAATRYFRRVVTSTAYCSGTSNTVKITVLPLIGQNEFVSPDTVICKGLPGGTMNALPPSGGDGFYAYSWQSRSTSGNWTDIPSSGVMRYTAGILTDSLQFRRIVFSGNDLACIDTSPARSVHVLPVISANFTSSDSSRYCHSDQPLPLIGNAPQGGNGTYGYQWLVRTSGSYSPIPGATDADLVYSQPLVTDTRFARIVTSGLYNACRDTSVAFLVEVVPAIVNQLELEGQTICEGDSPDALNAAAPAGGFGGYTYKWIYRTSGQPGFSDAPGVSDMQTYDPGTLVLSTRFVRLVSSDICTKGSDTLLVTVYPALSSNSIEGSDVQYTCLNTSRALPATTPLNGFGSYAYLWQESADNTVWTPAGGSANDLKDYPGKPLSTTTWFRRIVYSSPDLRECADTASPVEVRINSLPFGDVLGGRDTICAGGELFARFNVSGDHGPFSVTVGNESYTFTAYPVIEFLDSVLVSLTSDQTLTMISIVDDSLCLADLSGATGALEVEVFEVPVANPGPTASVCGLQHTLSATRSVSGSEVLWSCPGVVFTDITSPLSQVTANVYGTKVFNWKETNWQCTVSAEVPVTFYEQPPPANAGADQVLDFKFTTRLEADVPLVGSGKWTVISGAAEFDNDTLHNTLVNELDEASSLRWTVTNGVCPSVSDEISIRVEPLQIPKGFSPNGDNKNDRFNLGAENAEWINIQVFNSIGILVFESDSYTENDWWDGFSQQGVEQPEGTYFYLVTMKIAGREKLFQFRSFIELLR